MRISVFGLALGIVGVTMAQDVLLTQLAKRDSSGHLVVLGTEGSWTDSPLRTKRSVFDGDPNTFFDPSEKAMGGVCWAGIELTKPQMPTRIRYLGRENSRNRAWGCQFQGANRSDFKDAVTLHVAAPPANWNANTQWIEVKLDGAQCKRTFRFFRVLSPNPWPSGKFGNCAGNFAEVEFYGTDLEPGVPGVATSPVADRADSLDEAIDLCRRTYDYVAKALPADQMKSFAKELDLDIRWAQGTRTKNDRVMIEKIVRNLRRRILFAHPDLQFDKLLCAQREVPYWWHNHMVDQYLGRFSQSGPGLIVLENWRTHPEKKVLLAGKLPEGCVLNPDLNWEADRILFAFCDHTRKPEADISKMNVPGIPGDNADCARWHRRYFIYECAADGSWVRQITGVPGDPMTTDENRATVLIEDLDPCYLPDGGFAFTSTRCQNFGRCHWGRYTPVFMLYRGELPAVGASDPCARKIRPLSFGEANEWEPSVMNDGRLAYTRWDYIDRNAIWFQSLWSMRPDGTAVSHLYGNYSRDIAVVTEAKAIPGSSLLVATAGAHHMITGGSLLLFDALRGDDGMDPITRLTPEIPFIETEGWKYPGFYGAPMPVNDTLFFASYTDEPGWYPRGHPQATHIPVWPKRGSTSIWLVDKLGGRELIYQDPVHSTFNPIPMIKRKRPPVLASASVDSGEDNTGVCYVVNCYDSRVNLPKGSIAALRINRFHNLPCCRRDTPNQSADLSLHKETLGTVPVNPDGSCAFRIPAGMPIQLQAIGTNGVAVFTMRSFIYSQKGEMQGCIGCHENKHTSRPTAHKDLSKMTIHRPKPEVNIGYTGPFRYALSVQPIFDRKCISCHGLGKAPSFIGAEGHHRLIKDRQIDYIHAYAETDVTVPGQYFAAGSALTKRLLKGHGPKLTDEEWRTLVLWMDLAVPEYSLGGYGWNRPETREINPEGEKALRAAVARLVGDEIAAQPFDALVNRGDETKSRVLWLCPKQACSELLTLCQQALKPHPANDNRGTCGRDDNCQCRSCWVRRGGFNDPKKK